MTVTFILSTKLSNELFNIRREIVKLMSNMTDLIYKENVTKLFDSYLDKLNNEEYAFIKEDFDNLVERTIFMERIKESSVTISYDESDLEIIVNAIKAKPMSFGASMIIQLFNNYMDRLDLPATKNAYKVYQIINLILTKEAVMELEDALDKSNEEIISAVVEYVLSNYEDYIKDITTST